MPNPTNRVPVSFFSIPPIAVRFRNLSVSHADPYTRIIHQILPVVKKVMPNTMNGIRTNSVCRSTNWGRNERKNSETFGFKRFVNTPCLYIVHELSRFLSTASSLSSCLPLRRKPTPIHIKYPAPAYFTILKANEDVAKIADKPRAANDVWINTPDIMPKTEIIPAFLPWAMPRPRMNIVSWPGVRFNKIHETKNKEKFCIPNMFYPFSLTVERSTHPEPSRLFQEAWVSV